MNVARKRSSSARTLRQAAGDVLVVGLEGPSLSAIEKAWLKLIRPAGFILFRRNIESPEQAHVLVRTVREAALGGDDEAPVLRAIDAEGGTVDRLRDAIADMPSAQAVWGTRDLSLAAAHGRLIARQVRMLGLNVTFAPVLDLRNSASASVLASRAVSSNPAEVTLYAGRFLEALAKEDVAGCGKHFPGLGSGTVDSHYSTPWIEKPFQQLWKEDLWPYRELATRLKLVMISHACYPETRSGTEPASVSHFWITEILKKRIGFRGLIVSDDMEMGGILSQSGLSEAVLAAVLAGVHLIEICRDPALVVAAYETLLSEAERSPAFARHLVATSLQSRSLRKKYFRADRPTAKPPNSAVDRLRTDIQRFSEAVGRLDKSGIKKDSGR